MSKSTRAAWEQKQLRVVETPEAMPSVEWVLVTPALATEWLKLEDPNNRPSSPLRVSMYARDMAAGRWHRNNQTIGFDGHGVVVDGGHRLRAVIEAGVPVWMLVARGVSRDGIDRGRSRSVADSRRMRGEPVSAKYIASIKILHKLIHESSWRAAWGASVSDDELLALETVEADACEFLRGLAKGGKGSFPAPIYAAMGFALPINRNVVIDFSKAIRLELDVSPRSAPILMLRQLRNMSSAGAQNGAKLLTIACQALRNYANGVEGQYIHGTDEAVSFWRRMRGIEA